MRAFFLLPSLLALCLPGFVTAQQLPALGADRTKVSVSGLSSGAFMAVQYSVAWSSEVMGVGVVAGGLYNCGAVFRAAGAKPFCMDQPWSPARSWDAVTGFARDRVIDPVANIARQRVYLFSGSRDSVVVPAVMRSVRAFYTLAGVPRAALRYVDTVPASHAFVSATIVGGGCGDTTTSFVVSCIDRGIRYDQPYAILNHIYGLKAHPPAILSAAPVRFDQRLYRGRPAMLADSGYVFVPEACRERGAACAVHVVFHGCLQSADTLSSDIIYSRLGYNGWADSNRIIMLYPQVDKTTMMEGNPFGCWDWWGYSEPFGFQLRHGLQIDAVRRMVARLEQQP
ncbi:extracellular catalytic domain type 2 short-chain-length polyhydroxyalkanoate depolymerase [Sphingomonas pituitosa]|uniref:extracellular catalytic domain type 2 short-chain-length polyhydroxyalkanoate depolymerase n=1 Tax=Sphingomonas pituitosa TaxID=99597 RepID=UPI000AC1E076|nr:depolymerase [Sphingomonas pituitosa]